MTLSILVIEKARSIATMLRRNLDTKAYTISSTYQRTALTRVKKRKPDIILVDSIPFQFLTTRLLSFARLSTRRLAH